MRVAQQAAVARDVDAPAIKQVNHLLVNVHRFVTVFLILNAVLLIPVIVLRMADVDVVAVDLTVIVALLQVLAIVAPLPQRCPLATALVRWAA